MSEGTSFWYRFQCLGHIWFTSISFICKTVKILSVAAAEVLGGCVFLTWALPCQGVNAPDPWEWQGSQSLVPADGLCTNHSFLPLDGCSLRHIPTEIGYGDWLTRSWVEFLGCWCISIRTRGSLEPCCSVSVSFIVPFFVVPVRSIPKSWRSWRTTLLIMWIKEDSICEKQLQYLE